ncbi:MAG: hypothetical protein IJ157_06595 [Clostridia bacterium]|nr:hypothetical protein [Clostridia bacterium]
MRKMLRMRLDLFGEETASAAPETGAAGTASEPAGEGAASQGVSALPTREGRRQNIFPAVPKQEIRRVQDKPARPLPTAMAPQQAQQDPQPQEKPEETFEELIHGRFKKEYGQAVQAAIQERFKNHADSEEALRKANAALASVAPFFGVQIGEDGTIDMEKLTQAIQNDDRLYEEEALQKGIPVSTLKQLKQLEARQRQQEAAERRSLADEKLRQHFEGLKAQAEELKKIYPDFDLMAEIQGSREFARMTGPGGGLTVQQAYMALHGEELMQRQAQQTEERTKSTMSRAIQSGSVRPQENGMAQSGGGQMKRDPHYLSREERKDIRRRVQAGERVIP